LDSKSCDSRNKRNCSRVGPGMKLPMENDTLSDVEARLG
jgi:hypothetical protein